MFVLIGCGEREWGYHTECVPVVGDLVELQHGEPDEEPGDFVLAVVTSRKWWIPAGNLDGKQLDVLEVVLAVELLGEIPVGDIAASEEWPSEEYSKRKAEHEDVLERIRAAAPRPAQQPYGQT